ncbi:tail fiber domain-containing protein [Deltaproteobacteria bacterium]|nr:tail fiber domain-containing protein [Deltaproteobacteria bacterium]
MSAYSSRQSTLHDGNIISAALFNNEFNAILNAFTYASTSTTGHRHDGTAGQGGNIFKIGDQDFLNKVVIESNEIKFFIEVSGAAVEQLNLVDGVLAPETNNDVDLGTSSKRFKTIYATTLDVSTTITNAQLAGSIANNKLANSTVSYGGVSLALGASDATPAFDLSDATSYPTSSLSGTITNAQLAGSIANAKLSNSSVSYGGVSLALGASDATPAFNLADATGYLTSNLSGTITNAQLAGSIAGSKLAMPLEISDGKTSEEDAIVTITNSNSGTTQDGRIIEFITGSNFRGSVGVTEVAYGSGSFFAGPGCGLLATTQFSSHIVQPCDSIGDYKDNSVDLGSTSVRFDDVYATNGTIQTSDRNEKQDIAELSDAERRVAVAAKGLLRKFRWIDAVTEKGDNARTHFGIIAQDLQAAFTAEGLDAGDYAMFISTTWWEHEGEVYTKDAPEGATAKTRLGVRYPELLAFIIAAL